MTEEEIREYLRTSPKAKENIARMAKELAEWQKEAAAHPERRPTTKRMVPEVEEEPQTASGPKAV